MPLQDFLLRRKTIGKSDISQNSFRFIVGVKNKMRSIDIRPKVKPNDNEYCSKKNVTGRNQEGTELLELEFIDHIPKIQRKSRENQHNKIVKSHHQTNKKHLGRI
ncbi:MAG: hypothetical protein IJL57_00910 [Bacteroidales bacterium]|nr:hypothetical protein [Bacteroidales bacterium]